LHGRKSQLSQGATASSCCSLYSVFCVLYLLWKIQLQLDQPTHSGYFQLAAIQTGTVGRNPPTELYWGSPHTPWLCRGL